MIVADTNLIAYLLLDSPHTAAAEAVLTKDRDWTAPALWRHELRNILATYLRADRITPTLALRHYQTAEALILTDDGADTESILQLARSGNCSAYDAEFVALAKRLGKPLVSVDKRLLAAFPETVMTPETFASH